MTSIIKTLTFHGIDVIDVNVEVHISPGLPNFILVGLADKTIAESKERVRAAINSLGVSLPSKRIVVSLAPADIIKEGSHFDLAIACAILSAMNIVEIAKLQEYITVGELSLDGTIKPISGVLPAAIGAFARNKGIICPKENAVEAKWSGNNNIITPDNLIALVNHFKGTQIIPFPKELSVAQDYFKKFPEIQDIKGLEGPKRALEIAAAGGHNVLMCGAPGAGKSMLASRLPSILPPLSSEEMLECSMIYSVAGLIKEGKLQFQRPYRAPHHSCSMPAMVGGGMAKKISPGEISLAHNGVLFLDEFPEFPRAVIDALRQPLENRDILISRAGNYITFPAKFQLIAAMNPCRCGYLDDDTRNCNRAPKCAVDYQSKISGPIFDRIDLHIDVPSISPTEIIDNKGNTSSVILERVVRAREIQKERYKNLSFQINSELSNEKLDDFIAISSDSKIILTRAANQLRLSMRAYMRILKLARTIADLAESEVIDVPHISEAISYRKISNLHRESHAKLLN